MARRALAKPHGDVQGAPRPASAQRLAPEWHATIWDRKVDFVLASASAPRPVEVKSGRPRNISGLRAFTKRHPSARPLLVGQGGLPLDEFFLTDPRELVI